MAALSVNLLATNPPLTPPRRGIGHAVRLRSWEGLGVVHGPNAFAQKNVSLPSFARWEEWAFKVWAESHSTR
jgi:hypothetical protein